MTIVLKEKFEIYQKWDDEIFLALVNFIELNKVKPQILIMNSWTARRIDGVIAVGLFEKGIYDFTQSMGKFSCAIGDLRCCVDEDLKNHEFQIIFDDEAEFLDPDPSESKDEKEQGGNRYAS
jgi:hypothetical protein